MGRRLPVWLYWEGPRSDWIERCRDTVLRHVPEARLLDWQAFDALRDRDRDIDLAPLYVAHRADVIRAFLLARYGGIWIDSDCIVMQPLDALHALLTGDVFLAHRERQGQFSNAFLAATPGSSLAQRFYEQVRQVLRSGAPRGWTSLGAEPLEVAVAEARHGFHELDANLFQPICWSNPGEYFVVRRPCAHAKRVNPRALLYTLSNHAVQAHLSDHPGLAIMAEGTFFRHLLSCSAGAENYDEVHARRAVWERRYREAPPSPDESLSGPGSSLGQTGVIRERLDGLLRKIGVRAILDAGCGDFHWLSRTELSATYTGVDLVPEVIESNRRRYVEREFRVSDVVADDLIRTDVILCRDVLVHYDFRTVLAILRNFRRSGAEWLFTTTFPGHDNNHDITLGQWRPLNLELPPFAFRPPEQLIVERCTEGEGRYRDKALGLWRFADLPFTGSKAGDW